MMLPDLIVSANVRRGEVSKDAVCKEAFVLKQTVLQCSTKLPCFLCGNRSCTQPHTSYCAQ